MKIKEGYILRILDGEGIVVPTISSEGAGSVIELNETGILLWKALSEGASLNDLVKKLTDEYDVTEKRAKQDAEAFIKTLKDNNILE